MAVPGKPVRGPSTIVVDNGRIVSIQSTAIARARAGRRGGRPDGQDGAARPDRQPRPSRVRSRRRGGTARRRPRGAADARARGADERHEDAARGLHHGAQSRRRRRDAGACARRSSRGWVQGPRIVDAASSISTTGGHMDGRGGLNDDLVAHLPAPENLCDGVETCRKVVRRQIDRGADVIKFATTGGVNSGTGLATRMFDGRGQGAGRHRPCLRPQGRGPRPRRRRHQAGAAGGRGFDRARHGDGRRDHPPVQGRRGAYYVPTLSTVNGYLERLAANPNAYAPDVRKQIDWRIGITGQSLRKAVSGGRQDRLRHRRRGQQARPQRRRVRADGQIWHDRRPRRSRRRRSTPPTCSGWRARSARSSRARAPTSSPSPAIRWPTCACSSGRVRHGARRGDQGLEP